MVVHLKRYLAIISVLFLSQLASAQHHKHPADVKDYPRKHFHQKVGGREIYHLYINDTIVNYTGKRVAAMAINGNIPAPTLQFTEGDTAEIYVHNLMSMETSLHWHGLILPNRYDGVSYLTTTPIKAGETHLFKFPLVQHGTYWYHSHTMNQEQSGLYGAFIIEEPKPASHKEYTLLLSDWTDENPDQVERRLHTATDWYAIRKGSTQSYLEAVKSGNLTTKLANEWKRMTAMDVSDVYYDRFFANGKKEDIATQFKPGEQVRLRVINGSSSTYFWLNWAGGKYKVIASDGADIETVEADRMIIGVAETYDLLITVPDTGAFEFLATSEDRTNHTSLWLGAGKRREAEKSPRLNYFAGMQMMNDMMDMHGNLQPMGMKMSNQTMDMNTVMYTEMKEGYKPITLNYSMLRATKPTSLPPGQTKTLNFELTGNMNRYVWSINNKTVSESDKIMIKHGENLRIILYNNTMMRHPMHLHGHYFRVLNKHGSYSPLKNTLDIMPMERDTIEFRATESGDWFFHCHILYHMMSGMGRIFSYENSPLNPEVPDPETAFKKVAADDRRFYVAAKVGLESNGSEGNVSMANTRWKISSLWHLGLNLNKGFESETMAGRYFGRMQWLYAYTGFDFHRKTAEDETNFFGQRSNKNNRHTIIAGVAYTLPMLFIADARIDGDGKFRLQLGRDDIPLTSRLRLALVGNTDKEYSASLRYVLKKYLSVSSHYDSDMGFGAGITFNY